MQKEANKQNCFKDLDMFRLSLCNLICIVLQFLRLSMNSTSVHIAVCFVLNLFIVPVNTFNDEWIRHVQLEFNGIWFVFVDSNNLHLLRESAYKFETNLFILSHSDFNSIFFTFFCKVQRTWIYFRNQNWFEFYRILPFSVPFWVCFSYTICVNARVRVCVYEQINPFTDININRMYQKYILSSGGV